MKTIIPLAILVLVLPVAAFTQIPTIAKDFAVAQIAAGGGWETVLNLTNRGTTTYTGALHLFQASDGGPGPAWNPNVNGNAITDGRFNISLRSGETASMRITGPATTTESGFGTIRASSTDETSFIEGTLTYYTQSGGKVTDSVGVSPSGGTFLATIPFDDFRSLALALANANTTTATIQMKLFSASNDPVSTLTPPLSLQPNQQRARYLWQLFPGVQMTGGRLEIQSDVAILGTALTDAGGQFSSLPLAPAVKAYRLRFDIAGMSVVAALGIRVSGALVEVRALSLTHNGQPVYGDPTYAGGTLVDDRLEINLYSSADDGTPYFQRFAISPFSFSLSTVTGSVQMWNLNPLEYVGTGPVSMTAVN